MSNPVYALNLLNVSNRGDQWGKAQVGGGIHEAASFDNGLRHGAGGDGRTAYRFDSR